MTLPAASVFASCILAAAFATAATAGHSVVRREDRHNALAPGDAAHIEVGARGNLYQPLASALENGTAVHHASATSQDFKFQLKSIKLNKCLELDGDKFSTKDCDEKNPKQKFTAVGISGPAKHAVASEIRSSDNKIFCWSGDLSVKAADTCDDDSKKFKFSPSGKGCFRVKLFLNDRCLTDYMDATSDSCDLAASQWTAEVGQNACDAEDPEPEAVVPGEDNLAGGGAEGGKGGEAEQAVGSESKAIAAGVPPPNATTVAAEKEAEEKLAAGAKVAAAAGATEAVDAAANATAAAKAPAPPPAPPILGYRFMMKSIKLDTCLMLEDSQTFKMTNCDKQDAKQWFIAHGFMTPGEDVMAKMVTMHNKRVMCFIGTNKVQAYDESCEKNYKSVELEPAKGTCFKVKINANADKDHGFVKEEVCVAPPQDEQQMPATNALCNSTGTDALWTSDLTVNSCA